ncbi:MAG: ATP-binding cassette domain-containing protein [Spirochaetia bacterium]|nr:ATP-binding cassette domain-containing protein [Spirochaetia bacterium]
MSCNRGEVRALLGENGAGKSTLLKVLAGAYSADSGSIHIFGKVAKISSPKDAMKYGIGCVYQELSFIPDLTVAQNIFIGRYPRTKSGRIDRKKLYSWTRELLKEYEIDTIDPETKVGSLSLSKKQMIEEVFAKLETDGSVCINMQFSQQDSRPVPGRERKGRN